MDLEQPPRLALRNALVAADKDKSIKVVDFSAWQLFALNAAEKEKSLQIPAKTAMELEGLSKSKK